MDAGLDTGAGEAGHGVAIPDVGLVELGLDVGELGDPRQHRRKGIGEVVDDDHLVAGLDECDHRVAADETGSAGDQDAHRVQRLGGETVKPQEATGRRRSFRSRAGR